MTAETFAKLKMKPENVKTICFVLCCLFISTVFFFASNLIRAERLPIKIYTSADGLGNDGNGIFLFNSAVATIGGTITILNAPVDLGNVISGNGVSGIAVFTESPTEPYQIKRNRIGTNAAGDAAIANQQFGIFMGYPRHGFDSAARYRLGHERG